MHDHERVWRYAEKYFQRHHKTKFPSVRRVAKSIGMKQGDVLEACYGDPDGALILTGYNYCDEGDRGYPGDLTVETLKGWKEE